MTLVANFFGGPGIGKSTMAAAVYAELKWLGIDCELVDEYPKQLTWQGRQEELRDQLYILAKQNAKMQRLRGKVKVIVTDSPLLMQLAYLYRADLPHIAMTQLVKHLMRDYDNLNILLRREKEYNPIGRNQTLEEAIALDKQITDLLRGFGEKFTEMPGIKQSVERVVQRIQDIIA